MGFTLIELSVVVCIIAVLASLATVGFGPVRDRAEKAVCMGRMRSLHASLATYVQDNGKWPQEPEDATSAGLISEDWWLRELAPYGATPEVWICPTIKRVSSYGKDEDFPRIHYLPGSFDAQPASPYKYAMQPWLIEIAGAHGRGPNICFPDGSIQSMDDILKK
jgi:prepilin-type N-terminal cleavage/methylation domain-containing protein